MRLWAVWQCWAVGEFGAVRGIPLSRKGWTVWEVRAVVRGVDGSERNRWVGGSVG
ncbi:hypothetical protein STRIP9103_06125 [Streptomyces ipomoeae 91-03]|uniref:Uncharacterized protein n=1 Tax=Streptomyces ipomoeae 91-03 TaxID=698759 RepID=L1KTJ2_9ACTN|nr:hypothetical protein STRIP9103_06125 [Streptomyces ipomoeae 91-03]